MKKILLLFVILPFVASTQVQVGQTVVSLDDFSMFGFSLALSADGQTFVAGAIEDGVGAGRARVYRLISDQWIQIGSDIVGDDFGDEFGTTVDISYNGSIIAVGAQYIDLSYPNRDQIKVFLNQSDVWTQLGQDIIGETTFETIGDFQLTADGSTLMVNVSLENDTDRIRIYRYESGSWTKVNELLGSVPDESLRFAKISSDGNTIATSVYLENDMSFNHIRVFQNQSGTWIPKGQDIVLDNPSTVNGRLFVGDLSENGSILAISNNGYDHSTGQVKIYEYQVDSWIQMGGNLDGYNTSIYPIYFGSSTVLSGDGTVLAIGAPGDFGNGLPGYLLVYRLEAGNWIPFWGKLYIFERALSLSYNGEVLGRGHFMWGGGGGNWEGEVNIYDLTDPFFVLSVNDFNTSGFKLFPNPTTNQFTIQLNDVSVLEKVTIYNMLGQEVLSSKELVVNTSELTSGTYIVEIQTNQGKASKRLIIN